MYLAYVQPFSLVQLLMSHILPQNRPLVQLQMIGSQFTSALQAV
ncbi:hypothetical protein [Muribacter muris]|nr:hypothetical protein [Muribacter muris]